MTIRFTMEEWKECRSEITACWPDHYSEVYSDEDYAPDFDKYDGLAEAGSLLVVTARRGAELVGYTVSLIHTHLHQKFCLWGFIDSYWLRRDARGPRVALRMIGKTEELMKECGVRKVLATEKDGSRLLAWSGWRGAERVYVKEL